MEANNKQDLIYGLIFSEKLEFDIKISDYVPINSCDKFIEELKDVLKKSKVKLISEKLIAHDEKNITWKIQIQK